MGCVRSLLRTLWRPREPVQPSGTVIIVGLGVAGIKVFNHLRTKLPQDWKLVGIERNEYAFFPIPALRAAVERGYEKHCFAKLDHVVESTPGKCEAVILAGTRVSGLNARSVAVERKEPKTGISTEEVPFDYCIIATGASYQFPCRSTSCNLQDSLSQFTQFQDSLEASSSILVIGGGLAGIEFAGDVGGHFKGKRVVLVISRTPETMFEEGVPIALAERTLNSLRAIGVEVILGDRVIDARNMTTGPCAKRSVTLQSGRAIEDIDFVFVAIGNKANSSVVRDFAPDAVSVNGLVNVTTTLQLSQKETSSSADETSRESNIFAIGDVNGVEEQKSARAATKQALYAGQSIIDMIYGRDPSPYKPHSSPIYLFSIGTHHGGGFNGGPVWKPRLASIAYEMGLPSWCKDFRREYKSPPVQS